MKILFGFAYIILTAVMLFCFWGSYAEGFTTDKGLVLIAIMFICAMGSFVSLLAIVHWRDA